MPAKLLGERFATRRKDAESPCDGRQHEVGILERRQADEQDAVGEVVEKLGCSLDGEPRLAGTTGAGQRDEPDVRPPE